MTFYSGFSLVDDERFFEPYLEHGDYVIAGFSYGAIKAAREALNTHRRIDVLQLFSPAFFQTKKESFKRLQLAGYTKDAENYLDRFIQLCFSPSPKQPIRHGKHSYDELHELLFYIWEEEMMNAIKEKGIRIEVYLGLKDEIIDVAGAREFFLPFATVFTIREGNHFLQEYDYD